MGKQRRGLLVVEAPINPGIRWLATNEENQIIAELHINHEGGGEYSVRAGFIDQEHLIVRQRTFHVHGEERLNNLGLLFEAIEALQEGDL